MTLISLATWYLYAGGLVAVPFLLFGMARLDENAQGAWVFRPLLVPGVLLVWPLVLWRCVVLWRGEEKLDRHQMPRRRQERVSLLLICAVPLVIVVALLARQDASNLNAPVQLEAPE